ncbi:MAG: NADH-quinone oxidoreductase subunit NuoG [Rhodospirillales bacterium]
MPKLTVNGIEVEVAQGETVLQACEAAGAEIPRFCYHEKLSIAGNCRMCLVEMEKAPKPVASCAMPAGEGMVIHTNSPKVEKARKGVMEFLLINHPLDCPICDQGGECDLQDQAMGYGMDHSRFKENKRAVKDKYMGPIIKTIMTRCIHCTRCVRFAEEIAGVPSLGALGRGENMEITTYLESAMNSEMSGNVIDLCPVGALTSKPYAFNARPWELRKTESIDVMDAVGSNIRVDTRGNEVLRVLPRINEEINEEWIADKTRYACDGLQRQRLDRPYLRKGGKLQPVSWQEAFDAVTSKLKGTKPAKIAAIAGDQADAEAMTALKDLMASLGVASVDCRQDGATADVSTRAAYIMNTTILGIEDADACLLIGTNPRWEAPLVNARLRKRHAAGGFRIARVGTPHDLTYPVEELGAGADTLKDILDGKQSFADVLNKAERPMLILGAGILARPDGNAILATARAIAEKTGMIVAAGDEDDGWNGFNVMQLAASRVGGLDLGLVPGEGGLATNAILEGAASGDIEVVYLLAADELDMSKLDKAFVVYQGHHGDAGAQAADVILPGAAYTEKDGTWVNVEGRVQTGRRAVSPPGEAREDWKIFRALSDVLGKRLPYDNIDAVRARMAEINPVFAVADVIQPADWADFGQDGEIGSDAFASPVANYYMTDPVSRCSKTMAECTSLFVNRSATATGTEG